MVDIKTSSLSPRSDHEMLFGEQEGEAGFLLFPISTFAAVELLRRN